jgi:cytochrome c
MRSIARVSCFAALIAAALGNLAAHAQLSGHGGPVRALAISGDGATALSGSFDASAILWSLRRNVAEQVLRLHDGAVNAVAILNDGRAVTAGEDARIGIWTPGKQAPDTILEGHAGPIVALALSPAATMLASASWDLTIRLWPLAGGPPRILGGHRRNVNGIAFTPDGDAVVSAGYDAILRIWPLSGPAAPVIVTLPSPLNAVAIAPDGEIAAAGADGKVYLLSPTGEQRGAVDASPGAPGPVLALAISRDGARIAAANIHGSVVIIDRSARRIAGTLAVSGQPIWSIAFFPDSRTLLSGGADRMIRRWDSNSGEPIGAAADSGPDDPLAAYAGDPGAQVFRACVACHSLKADEGSRAGPTLHGIFGRRIATLPGYNFSPALKHLEIMWTPETVAKLFEIGPAAYTPGTKMPQQRIGRAEDRDALVRFLERATTTRLFRIRVAR